MTPTPELRVAHAAPDWFSTAIAHIPTAGATQVAGCSVAHLRWGRPGAPGLVLLHGGAAHAHWWDHLGPLLAAGGRHDVLAVDLSGHGDSGWRERYSLEGWAEEALTVVEAVGMAPRPVVIGHSMGGVVTIDAAAGFGDQLGGAIVVDSPVRRPDPESQEARAGRAFRRPKTYPDLDTAMEHFHLIPPQPSPPSHVVEHIARHSLRRGPDGWTWKFDPALWAKRGERDDAEYGAKLERVRCRLAVVHGQRSGIVDAEVTDHMAERLGRAAPFVEIPEAHHHLILDQPLAFVAAVRALLADWEHSQPHVIPGLG